MVITAATSINEQAQAFDLQVSLKSDAFIPSMTTLANAIKEEGAKAIVQLHHGGRMNLPSLYENHEDIVSASAIKAPREGLITPRALTTSEVEQTIEDFAVASARALKAGFDGVELHGANTYLIQQFFSPHSNRRTDRFGGSLEARMTFIKKLVLKSYEAMKKENKPFILGYRFSPEELEEPGITIEDTLALISLLKTLPLDYLHISLRRYDQSSQKDPSQKAMIVSRIQAVLNHEIPLIGVGGIETHEDVEDALEKGFDLVAGGTVLLTDPLWGESVANKRLPSRAFKAGTIPTPLYKRLLKSQTYFEDKGYTYES
jgi:2,4-dienoyl-CoA reductase-like NADH-dependent reductase (Old Yellow Enzyme family)